jgi:hypothetical protein
MKANTMTVNSAAAKIAKAVKQVNVDLNGIGILIRDAVGLFDLPELGAAIGEEWAKLKADRPAMRHLATACWEANLSRPEASSLLNATGLVSHVAVIGALNSAGYPPTKAKPPVAEKSTLDRAVSYVEKLQLNKKDLKALIAKLNAIAM